MQISLFTYNSVERMKDGISAVVTQIKESVMLA